MRINLKNLTIVIAILIFVINICVVVYRSYWTLNKRNGLHS